MAKVLISFLGTGRIKDENDPKRKYEPATYKIGKTDYSQTFVSLALREHFKADRLLLIGTTHSMWEEVYLKCAADPDFDIDIWGEISRACAGNKHTSALSIPRQNEIEAAMGDGSKVVLVRYGLNTEEIKQNSDIILGLDEYLRKGDELIVDITHSFRSLPLLIMNLLIYLRDVSTKKVSIKGIYYGMLEATKEVGYTPVVDLSEVMNVNSWISGAYSFMEFGNAYKISSLIPQEYNNVSQSLLRFSNIENLNHLVALQEQYTNLKNLANNTDGWPLVMKKVIPQVVKKYTDTVRIDPNGDHITSDFQYKIAIWQQKRHNYLAAYSSLSEAVVTRCGELILRNNENNDSINETVKSYYFREAVKEYLKNTLRYSGPDSQKIVLKKWAKLWDNVKNTRNALVHAFEIQTSPEQLLSELAKAINTYTNNRLHDSAYYSQTIYNEVVELEDKQINKSNNK